MISALLITILPTLLFSILLPKVGLHLKSMYLRIAFAWFVGVYLFSMGVFLLAHVFVLGVSPALSYASFTGLLIVIVALAFFPKKIEQVIHFLSNGKELKKRLFSFDTAFVLFCFFFSVAFFTPHLLTEQNTIYQSPIYWDFHWHVAIIQNFAFGDNFPPQDESFAGVPLTYHYFGDFVIAMYEAVGLSLTQAVNFMSTLVLFFFFITIVGVCQELFHRKSVGYIAAILTMTSSSWRFVTDFRHMEGQSIFQMANNILTNTAHPFHFSFLPDLPTSVYAGTMFNLFYYLEERHMMFGFIYLLLAIVILYKRKTLSNKLLFVCGMLFGAFFFWHLYITAMVLIACLFLLFFDGERKKTLLLLVGFFLTAGPQYSFIKETLANPSWFYQHTTSYPRFNPTFATSGIHNDLEVMIQLLVAYFVFAYGIKIIFFIISFCIIWTQNKTLAKVLAAIILPAFLMINTLEISPQGMGDNHKLLVPMNVVVNLVAAVSISLVFFQKRTWIKVTLGCICLFFMTISGIIELMPFVNSKPTDIYAHYGNDSITQIIRRDSQPHDVFLGRHQKEIHLAGRKLFIGPSAGPTSSFNKDARNAIVKKIYLAPNFTQVCQVTQETELDYVEFVEAEAPAFNPSTTNYFTAKDDDNNRVVFINVKESCNKL